MSIEKSKIKQGAFHEIGVKIDDMLEANTRKAQGHAGAKIALRSHAEQVSSLQLLADNEFDANPDIRAAVKKYVSRAHTMALTAAQSQENHEISTLGEINFARKAITVVKTFHDSEGIKAERIATMEDGDENQGRSRPVGVRPGQSIAQQRKAEAAEEKTKEETKPVKRKRGRPRKKKVA